MDRAAREIIEHWSELVHSRRLRAVPAAVDFARLEEVMEEHTPKVMATVAHLPPIPGVGSANPLVAASYILTGNIWNFHFKTPGEPPYRVANPENPDKPYEGFMAFWHKLYRQFGEHVITAEMLRPHVESVDAVCEFFRDLTEIPLPELRQRCGLDFVRRLEERYDGYSLAIFRDTAHGGKLRAIGSEGIIEILVGNFPVAYGEDYRLRGPRCYNFDKRARLAAMMLHQYAINSDGKMRTVDDMDAVAPPIDYQIPRILHSPQFRVLRYVPELDRKIEQGVEVERDSLEELAIRATAMIACCYWMEKKNVPGWLLDAYLFANSRGLPNKAHYTKTADY